LIFTTTSKDLTWRVLSKASATSPSRFGFAANVQTIDIIELASADLTSLVRLGAVPPSQNYEEVFLILLEFEIGNDETLVSAWCDRAPPGVDEPPVSDIS
jgi:hypothetical protein